MRTHSSRIYWRSGLLGTLFVTLLLSLAVLALTFSATQAQPPTPLVEPILASTEPTIEYAPNTLLLKLKPGVTLASGQVNAAGAAVTANADSLNGLLNALGVTTAAPLFAQPGAVTAAQAGGSRTGLERIHRVQWSSSIPVEHAVAALAADPAVEYAEPDYIARAARTPNDPEYASQWALPKINAPAAWDITTGAADVVIAIVDSGVETTHPDFAGRLWVNDDPANGADDDGNGQIDDTNGWNVLIGNGNLTDPSGHGTQVGGVAGAATDNGAGVAGLCWGCKLMFVNAMQASGVANYSDIAAAVQYAASNGADVINLSLGGYADSAALRDAIREAATTAVIVAGAGNDDSSTPFYPAAYPEVLAVAATDPNDQKAIFSNYGAWIDVSAPGKDIRTTTVAGYATDSGTSLAAPFVAGLAGLVKSQHPAWTAEQVKWQVLNTAVAIDALNPTRAGQLGKGRIDAGAALASDPQPRAAVESYALDGQANARPAPGQTFQLVLTVRNLWLPGQALQGTLTSSDPYVSISDGAGAFGDIAPGQLGSNSSDPFGVTVSGGAPYNHALQFTLNLSGAGGYSLAVPFTIQVRSAVETLGNTIYSADTTWTSDKTYVLAGAVIVNPGVVLTIQPGTVVKANPGKFLRVDGTLVARGTAAQPILFTTNSITNATWSGIRFADTAVDASYDAEGNYLAGSVLQFVELSYADIAASLSTRAPYIADSTFRNNATSIQVGNNNNGGAPHIERNEFLGGGGSAMAPGYLGGAITLSGGQPLIRQNSFVGSSPAISNGMMSSGDMPSILGNTFRDGGTAIYVSGSPTIIGNAIQNNSGVAIRTGGTPVIRDNVIVGNGGGINASSLQLVDIEHNLIANNGAIESICPPNCGGGTALSLDVQSSGGSLGSPALSYNAALDEYLAVWTESDSIKAVRLGADGQSLADEIQVSGVASMGIGGAYVAYHPTQNQYFVAWGSGVGVQTRLLTADGKPIGSVSTLPDSSMAVNVKVRYQPFDDTFLVAYQTQDCTNGCRQVIYAQRITTAGAVSGNRIAVGSDLNSNVSLGDISVDTGNDRSLIVFHSDSWYHRIGGVSIGPSTQVVSTTIVTENLDWQPAKMPAAAFASGVNRHVVVYEHYRWWDEWHAPRNIDAQSIDVNGVLPISPTTIYSDAGRASAPIITYSNASGEFFTAWAYTPELGYPLYYAMRLHGQRVDSNGNLTGPKISIAMPVGRSQQTIAIGIPAIAYNSQRNEYLVAWMDNRTGTNSIWGQRVSATGQLLDNAWTPADETNPANNFRISQPRGVRYNTIIHNMGYGIQLGGQAAASVSIANNNLFGNGSYDLYLTGGQAGTQNLTVDAANNFWNVDASQIPNRIRDCTFDDNGCGTASSTVGQVAYNPPLANPDQSAPAFVRSVTMNPNPVGLQRGTVTVDFSKPMSVTALPAASFHDARRGTTQQVLSETAQVMAQDVLGRMWFGLSTMMNGGAGVRMYNGRTWTTYTSANSGLGSNRITALYGAATGDMWFAHDGASSQALLSKLQDTTWITFTGNLPDGSWLGNITAINQDSQGAMWFGGYNGAVRYDGSVWQRYTTANGLADNQVRQIACDGQGQVWILTDYGGIGGPGGLSVFDGVNWRTYGQADGLPPAMYLGPIFADSRGRIWVNVYNHVDPATTKSVAMFDGSGWTFFGSAETGGQLTDSVSSFAETSDGAVWMNTNTGMGRMVLYHDGEWSSAPGLGSSGSTILFDQRNNLWYNTNGLNVRWGGLDHPFTDGQWLSPTRFQASFTFDANILPGFYTVQTDGAIGDDGMAAYATSSDRFQVDFGAGVTLDPPAPPQVAAQTNGSLTHLTASWQANSPAIDQYRYAIGATPGGRDVVGWTYLAATSFTRSDLALKSGQSYYVTVQARNSSGLWSVDGVSNGVIGGQVATPTPPPASGNKLYLPTIRR